MASSVVTIKIEQSTLRLLKALKEETGSKNYDDAAQSNFIVKWLYVFLNSTAEHTENAKAPKNLSNFRQG